MSDAAKHVAILTRALVDLEERDRVGVKDGKLSGCRRCGSVALRVGMQSHRDDCPYAALAKVVAG